MSLKHYLELAYREVHITWEDALSTFDQINAELQKNRENLILIYGGSFNPPHRGHIDVLLSGLRPEIGASAIILLPCEDYLLRNKMVNNPSKFFLNMSRRAALWDSIPSVPRDKVWVWMETYFPFKAMTEALIRLTHEDGYKLVFSHMIGPDILRLHKPLIILPYVFPRMLVTNKARHIAAHFSSDGTPVVWDGFGAWSRSKQSTELPDNAMDGQEVVLWTCNGIGDESDPKQKGYYLQFTKPNAVDVNSTYFRETLIDNHTHNETNLDRLSVNELLEFLAPIL